jgi:hypothetical protein
VEDEKSSVLPRLIHDNRYFFTGLQRSFTSDSRSYVCNAIEITINFLYDFVSLDMVFTNELLKIDIETGLISLAKFYIDDVNVSLCKDKCVSIVKTTRMLSNKFNIVLEE